jgi:hypothetical protein
MKLLLVCCLLLSLESVIAQHLVRIGTLPPSISESSGLVFYNDTLLLTHNDSGDKPIIYFINLKGRLIHQVLLENASNVDWEDLCTDDKKNLYIGDIGNNNNNRKDLKIYKVSMQNLLGKESVHAEQIIFSYSDQKSFPPIDSLLNYDAEGLAYQSDSLLIFTKCRANPFNGYTYCYKIPTNPGSYKAHKSFELYIGNKGFMKDAVTAATVCGNLLYLLTYNRFLIYEQKNNRWIYKSQYFTKPYTQKEAIITKDNHTIFISDEVQKIVGGGKLYKMELE